ncbi:MAG TPA: hypothetical protein VHA77_04505 [Xanthobacteraceae bacterium]|jgi:hypothetical protein|nr:hypothetical protein [Xanthobacteraceae bacterium]
MRIGIESAADARGVGIPRRLHLRDREIELVQKLDEWHGADHRYFKLKGNDGNLYIVRFDETDRSWELIMFQHPRGAAAASASIGSGRRP